MNEPYETPEFSNSAEFTVVITLAVAGGKRPFTVDRRARRIFERLANHAARCKDVLQVTAKGGPSCNGEISWSRPVAFTAANTSPDSLQPDKAYRYLDPDYERALRALAAANRVAQARAQADRDRRRVVGCANASPSLLDPGRRSCQCVYCQPEEHLLAARLPREASADGMVRARCLCGQPVPAPGQRCLAHRGAELQLLDGDPAPLCLLGDHQTTS